LFSHLTLDTISRGLLRQRPCIKLCSKGDRSFDPTPPYLLEEKGIDVAATRSNGDYLSHERNNRPSLGLADHRSPEDYAL
jgi:hypothetical protein